MKHSEHTKIVRFVSGATCVLIVVSYQKKVVCIVSISNAKSVQESIMHSRRNFQLLAAVVIHLLMMSGDGKVVAPLRDCV